MVAIVIMITIAKVRLFSQICKNLGNYFYSSIEDITISGINNGFTVTDNRRSTTGYTRCFSVYSSQNNTYYINQNGSQITIAYNDYNNTTITDEYGFKYNYYFKNGKYDYLITTAVLERGVTIKNLQVIIYNADHELYDEHALIQISGRVGRKYDAPKGEVIFLVDKITNEIKRTISTIEDKNKSL